MSRVATISETFAAERNRGSGRPATRAFCAGITSYQTSGRLVYPVRTMRNLQSLLVFVAILVVLNLVLSEVDYGVHISIVGSIVLTLVVSFAMNAMTGRRR